MKTAESQYLDILQECHDHGVPFPDGERTGVGRRGLWQRSIEVNLSEEFPLLTTKKLPFRWIAEELIWMLSGSTDELKLRAKGVDIWKEWSDFEHTSRWGRLEGDLGPVYGHQWRNFGSTEQPFPHNKEWYDQENNRWVNPQYHSDGMDQTLPMVKGDPSSTRLIMSGWGPGFDKVDLPPCHTLFQIQIRNGSVNSTLFQRSCDHFLGVPFNLASYALLTNMIAQSRGLRPGVFVHHLSDVHVYDNHGPAIREQLSRGVDMLPSPEIKFYRPKEFLWQYTYDDFEIFNYEHLGKIEAEVAV